MGATENYRKHLEKVRALSQQGKRRPLNILKGLNDFSNLYAEIAEMQELKKATKSHLFAIIGAMGRLKASESALGLFSDSFEDVTELMAEGICTLTMKNPPLAAPKLVKRWLQLTVIVVTGLLELARHVKPTTVKEKAFDPKFKDELLLNLLFNTDYPRFVFGQMAVTLNLEKKKEALFIAIFESIAIITALSAYSKDEEGFNINLAACLIPRLAKNLQVILSQTEEETMGAFIQQMQIAIDAQDHEGLIKTWVDLMEAAGYNREAFLSDLKVMKDLFLRYKEAFTASRAQKTAMVHVIG